MCGHMYVCVYACICVCVCVCAYAYVCMSVSQVIEEHLIVTEQDRLTILSYVMI